MKRHAIPFVLSARQGICTSIAAVMLFSTVTGALAQDTHSFVREPHRAPLQAYLAQHPQLSIAPDSLCMCDEAIADLKKSEPGFQPYYAVGDANDDGIEDFAVGLVNNTQAPDTVPLLTIVVFHGPFSKGRRQNGIAVVTDLPIKRSQEMIFVLKPKIEKGYRFPARLALGAHDTDDFVQIFFDWKRKKYYVGPG